MWHVKRKTQQIRVWVGLCFCLYRKTEILYFPVKLKKSKKPTFKKSKDFGHLDVYRRRESHLKKKYQAKKNLTYGTKILCKEKKISLPKRISLLLRKVVVPTQVKNQSWFWSWSVSLSSKSKYVVRRKLQSLSAIRRATDVGQKKTISPKFYFSLYLFLTL